jgi:peptidoglycan hydrolase-like protein with peptidoglycan-binding domain
MGDAARLTALYTRLRSDQSALQLYTFQTLMYQLNLTNATPDGIMGPVTTAMIQSLQQQDSLPVTGTFDPSLIAAIVDVTNYQQSTPMRTPPDILPADIILAMDAFIYTQVSSVTAPVIMADSIPSAPTSSAAA